MPAASGDNVHRYACVEQRGLMTSAQIVKAQAAESENLPYGQIQTSAHRAAALTSDTSTALPDQEHRL
jgi:hypothetical protein